MKIQNTRINEQTDESASIELFLADKPDAEISGEFLKLRLSIVSAPIPRVSQLQLVALRRTRELIDEQIVRLQSLLSRHHVDIQ